MTKANFTSQKLDLINAISLDTRLLMSTRVVAVALLAHANSETWAIFPSQERIAALVGISERQVRTCIRQLEDFVWLTFERKNRKKSNRYAFDHRQVPIFLSRREAVAEVSRGSRLPVKAPDDRKPTSGETGSPLPLRTGSPLPPNNLKGNNLKGTPKPLVHEEDRLEVEVEQYTREGGARPKVDPTAQFDRMLAERNS